jgi:hypothetical protein
MPRVIPREIRDSARKLYFDDYPFTEMAEILSEQYNEDVKVTTLRRWSKEENWKPTKEEAKMKALANISEEKQQLISSDLEQASGMYHRLAVKSAEYLGLEGDAPILFDKPIDAVRAMDTGLAGERRLHEGVISAKFVTALYEAVMEHVSDDDTLRRIGISFQKIAADAQTE